MTISQEQAARLLKLPDADFFQFDSGRQLQLQGALAALAPEPGTKMQPVLVLGAPASVNLDQRPSVPVLVGSLQSGLREWQVNFRTNLHIFVRNQTSGELRTTQPLIDMRRGSLELRSGAGMPPDKLNAESISAGVEPVDLLKRMQGELGAGGNLVTALAYDVRSNTVAMQIAGGSAPSGAISARPQSFLQHVLDSNAQLTTRVEMPGTAGPSGPWRIGVAMQVRADSGIRKSRSGKSFWQCNFALVKLDERPLLIPVLVPVQEVVGADAQPAFNAVFTLDVRAAVTSSLSGTYQVYLDTGREMLGPYSMQLP